eukprot:EG_transcript_5190
MAGVGAEQRAEVKSESSSTGQAKLVLHNESRAAVLHSEDWHWYLLAARPEGWIVATLAPETGTVTRLFGPGTFYTPQAAWQALQCDVSGPLTLQHEAIRVCGSCTIGSTSFLLCVDEATIRIAFPVSGAEVFQVERSTWVPLISSPRAAGKADQTEAERAAVEELLAMSLAQTHFFSLGADLTAPLPYGLRRDWLTPWAAEFDWTAVLRRPFADAGLEDVCTVLLRGYAGSQCIPLSPKDDVPARLSLALLCRQDRRNPGPRITGRGLNLAGHPGNEFECELFLWWEEEGALPAGSSHQWARHIWRRGTVPITLNYEGTSQFYSLFGPPLDEQCHAATPQYFSTLLGHLRKIVAMDAAMEGHRDIGVQVVDLLSRAWPSEERLSQKYEEAVQLAAKSLGEATLGYLHFDWHGAVRRLGVQGAVADAWQCLPLRAASSALSSGTFSGDRPARLHITAQIVQRDFRRVNCADSLDRTNLISFFTALRLMATPPPIGFLLVTQSDPCVPCEAKAERRGCAFLCDTACPASLPRLPRAPTTAPPPPPAAPALTLACALHALPPDLLRAVALLFLQSGDTISQIFTGSAAMHSDIIRDLCPDMANVQFNVLIGIERGLKNMFIDDERGRQSALLLGQHPCQKVPPSPRDCEGVQCCTLASMLSSADQGIETD